MRGGKTLNDRLLAANVRTTSLKLIKKYLDDDSKENEHFKKQLILKLASTVLPRINEHTGEGGEPIKLNVINYDNYSLPISTQGVPTTSATSQAEVQDSGIPQESGEIQDSP